MISAANLRSALTLLGGSHSASITPDGATTASVSVTSNVETRAPISGATTPPAVSTNFAVSISDSQISGFFKKPETGNGLPPADSGGGYNAFQELVSENAMTDQQISDAAYSGGLSSMGNTQSLVSQVQSAFAMFQQTDSSYADQINQWLASGRTTPAPTWALPGLDPTTATDDRIQAAADFFSNAAQKDAAMGKAIIDAFNNHTLQIQNAADVQGLGFQANYTGSFGSNSATISGTPSWNEDFVRNNPDGKQHYLLPLGGAYVYLSW
ncbi:MAG: hypothetical protein EPN75_03295 [Beijerinckiaceae bacterium]|nr:MAG: hypothetical protein EPN75_03295 [Beijerinckiaceae bacterium]